MQNYGLQAVSKGTTNFLTAHVMPSTVPYLGMLVTCTSAVNSMTSSRETPILQLVASMCFYDAHHITGDKCGVHKGRGMCSAFLGKFAKNRKSSMRAGKGILSDVGQSLCLLPQRPCFAFGFILENDYLWCRAPNTTVQDCVNSATWTSRQCN
jgi:hypothetical protein